MVRAVKLPPFDSAQAATRLADAIRGPTSRRDGREMVKVLNEAKAHGQLGVVLRELRHLDAALVKKLVTDIADAEPNAAALWAVFGGAGASPSAGGDGVGELTRRVLQASLPSASDHGDWFYASTQEAPLHVFGAAIPAIARHDTWNTERGSGEKFLEGLYRFYDKSKLTQLAARAFRKENPDTPESIQAALTTPLAKTPTGESASLGDVTVVVNGLLNLNTTPAMLFRLARYSREALVVASSNPHGEDGFRLRPLTEVWGTPVPDDLKGKLWAIGDWSPNLIPWTDASDVLLAQLEAMKSGFPELAASDVTVLGYSQGALTAALTKKRLEDAGVTGVIDRVVSVSGSLSGTPFADDVDDTSDIGREHPEAVRGVSQVLARIDSQTGRRAIQENDPEFVERARASLGLGPECFDVAYGTKADLNGAGVEPFFKMTRSMMTGAAPAGTPADGVVFTVNPGDAKFVAVDSTPKTHLFTWKDWNTADRLAEAVSAAAAKR